MKFINAIISFFKNLFSGKEDIPRDDFGRESKKYLGQYIEELPPENEIEDNRIYIVGDKGYEWLAAFKCPCGCGDLIQLNLLEKGEHVWRIVRRKPQKISIAPSIDRTIGCKSHFTVTNGVVIWWINQKTYF